MTSGDDARENPERPDHEQNRRWIMPDVVDTRGGHMSGNAALGERDHAH